MPRPSLRFVTWNLFHGRDGLPGLGATRRSTWRGVPEDDGSHLHVNRKLTPHMARLLAGLAPDVCALQEVPTAAIGQIARITSMRAVGTTTWPLIGPRRVRAALAAANPDLWRTHEGNANVILMAPGLSLEGQVHSWKSCAGSGMSRRRGSNRKTSSPFIWGGVSLLR